MKTFKSASIWLVAIASIMPLSASAVPITWTFNGTFQASSLQNSDPAQAAFLPGSPYSLSVSFDTSQFVVNPQTGLFRTSAGAAPNAFSFAFNGLDCNSGLAGVQPCSAPADTGFSSLMLSNNITPGGQAPFDALTLTFYRGNAGGVVDPFFGHVATDRAFWQLVLTGGPGMFGAADLSNLNVVPTLTSFPLNSFLTICGAPSTDPSLSPETKTCDQNAWRIAGSQVVGGVSVPEPATLALLTLGLAGMGMVRRRRLPH